MKPQALKQNELLNAKPGCRSSGADMAPLKMQRDVGIATALFKQEIVIYLSFL